MFFKISSSMLSECQTAWNQIRPDLLSGLIWVQTVCKDNQRTQSVYTCIYKRQTYIATSGQRAQLGLTHFGRWSNCRIHGSCTAFFKVQITSESAFLEVYHHDHTITFQSTIEQNASISQRVLRLGFGKVYQHP